MKKFQPNALDRRDKMIKVKKPSFLRGCFLLLPIRLRWYGEE